MIKQNKYIIIALLAICAFALFTLIGPCKKPPSFKEEKKEVNAINDSSIAQVDRLHKLTDSLNTIAANSMRVIDSLVKLNRNTQSNLNAEKSEAIRWQYLYTDLINNSDTAGALVACDSIAQSNRDLIAIADDCQQLYSSTVNEYDSAISAKDKQAAAQAKLISDQRIAMNTITYKYNDIYDSQNSLRKKVIGGKVKQKVMAGILLAETIYILQDLLKK